MPLSKGFLLFWLWFARLSMPAASQVGSVGSRMLRGRLRQHTRMRVHDLAQYVHIPALESYVHCVLALPSLCFSITVTDSSVTFLQWQRHATGVTTIKKGITWLTIERF